VTRTDVSRWITEAGFQTGGVTATEWSNSHWAQSDHNPEELFLALETLCHIVWREAKQHGR